MCGHVICEYHAVEQVYQLRLCFYHGQLAMIAGSSGCLSESLSRIFVLVVHQTLTISCGISKAIPVVNSVLQSIHYSKIYYTFLAHKQ